VYEGKTVCVVIPAHNEEKLIARVIETIPRFVDQIIVVDDASEDATAEIAGRYVEAQAASEEGCARPGRKPCEDAADAGRSDVDLARGKGRRAISDVRERTAPPVKLIRHVRNAGVGAAVATGYRWALANEFDVTVVMDGDGQMDPADLPRLVAPVVRGEADYAKGDRLSVAGARRVMPTMRYVGTRVLTAVTRVISGYWHLRDSQSGYTAISLAALRAIDWDVVYPSGSLPQVGDLTG